MPRLRLLTAAAALSAGLLLVACGSDDPPANSPADTPTTTVAGEKMEDEKMEDEKMEDEKMEDEKMEDEKMEETTTTAGG